MQSNEFVEWKEKKNTHTFNVATINWRKIFDETNLNRTILLFVAMNKFHGKCEHVLWSLDSVCWWGFFFGPKKRMPNPVDSSYFRIFFSAWLVNFEKKLQGNTIALTIDYKTMHLLSSFFVYILHIIIKQQNWIGWLTLESLLPQRNNKLMIV